MPENDLNFDSIPIKVIESIGYAVVNFSLDLNKILYASSTFITVFGYLPDEFETGEKVFHLKDRQVLQSALNEALKSDELIENEYRIIDKEGKTRYINQQSRIVKNNAGVPTSLQGICKRVDLWKESLNDHQEAGTETELYKTKLKILQSATGLGIWEYDYQSGYTTISTGWAQILGFTLSEKKLTGKSWESQIHPEDRDKAVQQWSDFRRQKNKFYQSEYRLLTVSGAYVWVLDRGMVTERDHNNNPKKAIGAIMNIDEKKEREASSDQAYQLYQLLANNITDVITLRDTSGKILYTSPSVTDLLGYQPEELVNINLIDLIHPDDQDIFSDMYAKAGQKKHCPFVYRHKNKKKNKYIWLETLVKPVQDSTGKFWAIQSVSRDVSTRVKAEKDARKALHKKAKLDAMQSKFISIASHEFRTPLASIRISTDFLDLYTKDSTDSRREHIVTHLNRINDEIDKISDLIDKTLVLGKLKPGTFKVRNESIDLKIHIEGFLADITFPFDDRQVALQTVGSDFTVRVDVTLFDHTLTNLLENALKFSKGSKPPVIILEDAGLYIVLTVKDFGIGIPEGERSLIFQSFYRSTNASDIPGTGLGLSIVKDFLKHYGGSLEVKSKEGAGSSFIIKLNK